MAEGPQDYKRLEVMLKESDRKREKDLSKVEDRLDSALVEIKALNNGITIQLNEIQSQIANRDNGSSLSSILGNLMEAGGET